MARQQKKISKKELREDPLMRTVAQTQHWLDQHGRKLTYGVIALLVVVILAVMMGNSRKTSNRESLAELARARQTLAMQPNADITERLEEIAATHKGTVGGAEALIGIADIALTNRDYAKAVDTYDRFIKSYPKSFMLTAAAWAGKAAALASLGEFEEAARTYDRVAAMKDAAHMKPALNLKAAHCYEQAGLFDLAKKRVEQVLAESPSTEVESEARVIEARLMLKG